MKDGLYKSAPNIK